MKSSRTSENSLRETFLSVHSVKEAADFSCGRSSPNDTSSCRCYGNCKFSFPPSVNGGNDNLVRAIQLMRNDIWPVFGNASVRKAEISERLFRESVLDISGRKRELIFRISGIRVCRSFYFNATAANRRLFSYCCDVVSNAGDTLRQEVQLGAFANDTNGMTTTEELVVVFLDQFFSDSAALLNKGIDNDPAAMGVKKTLLTWKQIHKTFYVPFCKEYASTATYQEFCSVRKKYRPNYKRDRKAR